MMGQHDMALNKGLPRLYYLVGSNFSLQFSLTRRVPFGTSSLLYQVQRNRKIFEFGEWPKSWCEAFLLGPQNVSYVEKRVGRNRRDWSYRSMSRRKSADQRLERFNRRYVRVTSQQLTVLRYHA
jgi:hypothetical protein